jgi:hypothetical protein
MQIAVFSHLFKFLGLDVYDRATVLPSDFKELYVSYVNNSHRVTRFTDGGSVHRKVSYLQRTRETRAYILDPVINVIRELPVRSTTHVSVYCSLFQLHRTQKWQRNSLTFLICVVFFLEYVAMISASPVVNKPSNMKVSTTE